MIQRIDKIPPLAKKGLTNQVLRYIYFDKLKNGGEK